MKLYEIEQSICLLLDTIPETGEITPEFEAKLDILEQEKSVKIANTGLYIKNELSDIAQLKEEEENLTKRRKVKENKVAFLKEYLKNYLDEPVELPNLVIKFTHSEAIVTNENYNGELLSKAFPEIVKNFVSFKLDKTEAKKQLKAGALISGLSIEKRTNLHIK